jgi:hypothetical protein
MTKKSDPTKLKSSKLGWLLLGALSGAVVHAAVKVTTEGEWETMMLPPGQKPDGEGWEPMRAVEHTSIYGPLMGKPQAKVVWKRRRPSESDDEMPRFSLAEGGFGNT